MACLLFDTTHLAYAATGADTYPDHPIKLVVPWPAGGTTDLGARVFAQLLSTHIGNSVVVENRPGATGVLGTQFVAHTTADGYTLLLATTETHAINPFTFQHLSYDPAKDFISIGAFAINPYALIARGDFPAANLNELVALAKQQPGHFSYSSAGLGSASQIVMEMFKAKAGLNILHVPYQGEAPAVTALMGDHVDMEVLPVGHAADLRKSGKVKVYAVTTANRFPDMPDVATLREQGFKDIVISNWFGIVAPANTPAPVIAKLAAGIQATERDPKTEPALRALGLETFPLMSQPAFQKFVNGETARWGDVIKRADIHVK